MKRQIAILLGLGLALSSQALGQTGEIRGLLRDPLGVGISNIAVTAESFTMVGYTQEVATTDAQGHFTFAIDPGSWQVSASAHDLSQQGYFDLRPTQLSNTGQVSHVRLVTRRLDATHRILGQLHDENHQPLPSATLWAYIVENDHRYETNLLTGPDGSFLLGVAPALWCVACDAPPPAFLGSPVFPNTVVDVGVATTETPLTIVAPAATSTIHVTATNFAGYQIVARTEAYGTTYTMAHTVFGSFERQFLVFDGVWTVYATNAASFSPGQPVQLPEPVTVAVTNGMAAVHLQGTTWPRQTLRVRTVTPRGGVVSNAQVYARQDNRFGSSGPSVGPPFGAPGLHNLALTEGDWRVTASLQGTTGADWQVSRQVHIDVAIPPPDLDLVCPETGVEPRLIGTLRDSLGQAISNRFISCTHSLDGTNESAFTLSDADGDYAVTLLPGIWRAGPYGEVCAEQATVLVSNADVRADFTLPALPPAGTIPVTVEVVDPDGPLAPPAGVAFYGEGGYREILATAGQPAVMEFASGLFSTSAGVPFGAGAADDYTLYPSLRWQLREVTHTNFTVLLRQGPVRIEGRLRDDQGQLLRQGYASARTSLGGTNYHVSGAIASGYFSLNVFPGEWEVGVSTVRYPPLFSTAGLTPGRASPSSSGGVEIKTFYSEPPPLWLEVSQGVARCDFVANRLAADATLTVTVLREDGTDISEVAVFLSSLFDSATALTDGDGIVRFRWPSGPCQVGAAISPLVWPEALLLWPTLSLDLAAGSNAVTLLARAPTTCISGTVSNEAGLLPLIPARARLAIGATNYASSGCVDGTGHFCIPACPGTWIVELGDEELNTLGLRSVAPQQSVVAPLGSPEPVHFTLSTVGEDFRAASLGPPQVMVNGAVVVTLQGQVALSWQIERSEDFSTWERVGTVFTRNGMGRIEDATAAQRSSAFYRALYLW